MFFLSKLITPFLLPPGLFITLACITAVILIIKKKKLPALLLFITAILLYLVSITPIQRAFLLPLENSHPPLTDAQGIRRPHGGGVPSYIVVLGGGTVTASPEAGGRSLLSASALRRTVYGYLLHKQTGLPVILCGGIVFKGEKKEAEARVAKRLLLRLGMDEADILTDSESRNTFENAQNILPLLAAGGEELVTPPVILVTSAYHMKRSTAVFRSLGVPVIPAPTDYQSSRDKLDFWSFLPNAGNMEGISIALREYIGLFYYRIRYGVSP
jgi:uncharacterized SAM-binding protein YcdF (DUF218 family)